MPGRRVKEILPARGRQAEGQVLFVGGFGYSPDDVRLQTDTGRVVLRKIRAGQLQGGGLTGRGLGSIAPAVRVMEVPFLFDPGINILSFIFSAGIGVVFGYFPARRAAQLDPIEALRHE